MSERAITSVEPQILDKLSQVLRKLESLEQRLELVETEVKRMDPSAQAQASGDAAASPRPIGE